MEANRLIRDFIIENALFGSTDINFSDDDSFLEKGIIDSTGILELIMFTEETYGIEVEDDEVIPENFDSVAKLGAYIRAKTANVAVAD